MSFVEPVAVPPTAPIAHRMMTKVLPRHQLYGVGPYPCLLVPRERREPPTECLKGPEAGGITQQPCDVDDQGRVLHHSPRARHLGLGPALQPSTEVVAPRSFSWPRFEALVRDYDQARQRKEHFDVVMQTVEQASVNRQRALSARSARAGKHFEDAISKRDAWKARQLSEERQRHSKDLRRLFEHIESATEKREDALAIRSDRARQHFEVAKRKCEACQHQQTDSAELLRLRLEEEQLHHAELRSASLAQQVARASEHNKAVAQKAAERAAMRAGNH